MAIKKKKSSSKKGTQTTRIPTIKRRIPPIKEAVIEAVNYIFKKYNSPSSTLAIINYMENKYNRFYYAPSVAPSIHYLAKAKKLIRIDFDAYMPNFGGEARR